jgi:hypothetical protein
VATFTGRLELHPSCTYALPWSGKEELLLLSFTINVVQLIDMLKHFSTPLSAGLKKRLRSAKMAAKNKGI